MTEQKPFPKPATHPTDRILLWGVIILAIIVLAVAVYYLVAVRKDGAVNANFNTNIAVNSDQTVLTNTDETLTANTNAAATTASKTQYRNNAFGYTIQYNPNSSTEASMLRSTWDIQNPAENLYSEWGLSDGDNTVIVVSVYPLEKRDEVFALKKYSTTNETEKLNDEVTADYLKVEGEVHGYYFSKAKYFFVLSTKFSVGSAGYSEFN